MEVENTGFLNVVIIVCLHSRAMLNAICYRFSVCPYVLHTLVLC